MPTREPTRRTTKGTGNVKYTGPARPDIQTLIDGYRNLYPVLDDETFERLERNYTANQRKTTLPVLSARGNLVDGYHRLLILANEGRKQLNTDEYTIDYRAIDELSEMKAHVGYQEDRRQSTSAERAAMARAVMRRFGWSAGKFADEFGFKHVTVKAWLQRNPDPAWDAEMAAIGRIGKDGKVYTDVPESTDEIEPPKPRAIRSKPTSGAVVEVTVNKHLAELTNPELAQWILENADADDREVLAFKLENIAKAVAAIAESLRALNAPGDAEAF